MTTQFFLLKAADGGQQLLVDRELTAGRDPACDVVLDQGQASRKHAKLSPAAGGIRVEDLGSTNGTLINGKRISETTVLKAGDTLQMGKAHFQVEPQADAAAADPDATLLFTHGATQQEIPAQPSNEALADTQPEQQTAENLADSKAPPSWVLNNQQSVDGTKFISKDMMQNVLSNSGANARVEETVSEPTFIGSSDPVRGMRFQLIGKNKNQWEIGRSSSSNVMLNHDSVSSSHAQVIHESRRWKLVDLMSANGTYVNGKKCLTGYLASGDVVRFGHIECQFLLPAGAEAPRDIATDPSMKAVEVSEGGGTIKTAAIAFIVTVAAAGAALYLVNQFL